MLAEVQGPLESSSPVLSQASRTEAVGRQQGRMMKGGLEREVCPRCEKPVYDAEGFPAGGRRYHKRCFKCFSCSKKLEPTTVLCHKVTLFVTRYQTSNNLLSSGRFILPYLPSEGGAQGEPEDIRQHERHQASGREGETGSWQMSARKFQDNQTITTRSGSEDTTFR